MTTAVMYGDYDRFEDALRTALMFIDEGDEALAKELLHETIGLDVDPVVANWLALYVLEEWIGHNQGKRFGAGNEADFPLHRWSIVSKLPWMTLECGTNTGRGWFALAFKHLLEQTYSDWWAYDLNGNAERVVNANEAAAQLASAIGKSEKVTTELQIVGTINRQSLWMLNSKGSSIYAVGNGNMAVCANRDTTITVVGNRLRLEGAWLRLYPPSMDGEHQALGELVSRLFSTNWQGEAPSTRGVIVDFTTNRLEVWQ